MTVRWLVLLVTVVKIFRRNVEQIPVISLKAAEQEKTFKRLCGSLASMSVPSVLSPWWDSSLFLALKHLFSPCEAFWSQKTTSYLKGRKTFGQLVLFFWTKSLAFQLFSGVCDSLSEQQARVMRNGVVLHTLSLYMFFFKSKLLRV